MLSASQTVSFHTLLSLTQLYLSVSFSLPSEQRGMAQTTREWRLLVQDLKGRNHILPIFHPRRLASKLVRVTFKMHTVSRSQCAVRRQKCSFITHLVRICKHRCMTTTSLKWGAETVVNKHREGKKVNIWAKLGPSCAETGKEHNTWRQPRAKAKVLFVRNMSQTENPCSFLSLSFSSPLYNFSTKYEHHECK